MVGSSLPSDQHMGKNNSWTKGKGQPGIERSHTSNRRISEEFWVWSPINPYGSLGIAD